MGTAVVGVCTVSTREADTEAMWEMAGERVIVAGVRGSMFDLILRIVSVAAINLL